MAFKDEFGGNDATNEVINGGWFWQNWSWCKNWWGEFKLSCCEYIVIDEDEGAIVDAANKAIGDGVEWMTNKTIGDEENVGVKKQT